MDTWRAAYKGISFLGHKSAAALVALDDTMALHDLSTTADANLRSEMEALHASLKAVRASWQLRRCRRSARQLAIAEGLQHIQSRAPTPETSASPPCATALPCRFLGLVY